MKTIRLVIQKDTNKLDILEIAKILDNLEGWEVRRRLDDIKNGILTLKRTKL